MAQVLTTGIVQNSRRNKPDIPLSQTTRTSGKNLVDLFTTPTNRPPTLTRQLQWPSTRLLPALPQPLLRHSALQPINHPSPAKEGMAIPNRDMKQLGIPKFHPKYSLIDQRSQSKAKARLTQRLIGRDGRLSTITGMNLKECNPGMRIERENSRDYLMFNDNRYPKPVQPYLTPGRRSQKKQK
ncbi:hypothetical protein PGTUg99_020189 [Puccinia graminis f. sp. tritici]|uniref:Uncharacterized protein n=1 Tax=Puccinia graminis f. sp. tritici TaxID=56615 RepID=A0A5B0QK78_PUCGR|nr:hypothetical protein PGTUg99_020189 [Puccinia graminis f. sp. tritici]